MKNKKIIIGIVGLLAAILLILPGVFGGQIETQIRDIPNQKIYQDIAKVYGMEIEVTEYRSGWFSSEATFSITLPKIYSTLLFSNDEPKADQNRPLVYKIPVKHGPIMFGKDGISFGTALMEGELHFLGENLEGFPEVIKTLPTANYSTLFEFSGKQVSLTTMDKGTWSWQDEKGGEVLVSWEGIESLSVLDLSAQTLNGDFLIPMLSIEANDQEDAKSLFFEMKNLSGVIDYDLSQTAPLFTYEGYFELESGEMKINDPVKGETLVSFSGFREEFNLIRHEDPDIIGYNVPVNMGPVVITTGGETMTPFKSLKMVMEFDNIDQKSILEFYENYFDTFSQFGPGDPSFDSGDPKLAAGEMSQELTQKLIKGYLKFLELGLRFDIPEAFIELEQGTIEYSHKLQFPPLAEEDHENLQTWAMGAILSGDTRLSPEMTNFFVDKMLEKQLGPNYSAMDAATLENLRSATIGQLLLAKYLVQEEDGSYSANFSFENGIFTLNGNPMDLMQALGQTS